MNASTECNVQNTRGIGILPQPHKEILKTNKYWAILYPASAVSVMGKYLNTYGVSLSWWKCGRGIVSM